MEIIEQTKEPLEELHFPECIGISQEKPEDDNGKIKFGLLTLLQPTG